MTVSFTRFSGKNLTTQSDRTVINNYCSSVGTANQVGKKGVVAPQKLKFVVLRICFLIKKSCQVLTSRLGKTGHHQQIPCMKGEK